MMPPACARCGAPLSPVAADPAHPEWCNSCAARAQDPPTERPVAPAVVGAPGMPGAPPQPPGASYQPAGSAWATPPTTMVAGHGAGPGGLVVKTRMVDGLLTGLAAAGIGGVLWWAFASNVQFELWQPLAVVIGLLVGQGVLVGTRRGGIGPALLALACSSLAVVVAVYFIDRSLTIDGIEAAGRTADLPLWQGFSYAQDAVWAWVDYSAVRAGGWLLAPVAAVLMTVFPKARPAIG